jgi:hypothetical protein
LFVTTIVHVMFPVPRVCVAGEPAFVTDRSTWKAQDSLAEAGFGLLAFPVVRVAVLLYVPHSVCEVEATMCTL